MKGPNDHSLGWTQSIWNRAMVDVSCRACGLAFRKHRDPVRRLRRASLSVLCRDCFKKEQREINAAIVSTHKRKIGKCVAEARKLHQKARSK